jgi:hypothetical protein
MSAQFLADPEAARCRPGQVDATRRLRFSSVPPPIPRSRASSSARHQEAALRQPPAPTATGLRRLRPWAGHADHFHVRLECPPGMASCVGQVATTEGRRLRRRACRVVQAEAAAEAPAKTGEAGEAATPPADPWRDCPRPAPTCSTPGTPPSSAPDRAATTRSASSSGGTKPAASIK